MLFGCVIEMQQRPPLVANGSAQSTWRFKCRQQLLSFMLRHEVFRSGECCLLSVRKQVLFLVIRMLLKLN